MKKSRALLVTIALAASAAFAAPVAAQRPPGDVVVRSGGVGVEDRAALEVERARYNLRLAFAESDGGYVAEVHVRLTRPDGRTVYEGESDGPNAWRDTHAFHCDTSSGSVVCVVPMAQPPKAFHHSDVLWACAAEGRVQGAVARMLFTGRSLSGTRYRERAGRPA